MLSRIKVSPDMKLITLFTTVLLALAFILFGQLSPGPEAKEIDLPGGHGAETVIEFRSSRPGEAFLVQVTGRKAVALVDGSFLDTPLSFHESDDGREYGHSRRHLAFGAIGLDTEPGDYPLALHITYRDGSEERFHHTITVNKRDFPIQRITVDAGYVHLGNDNLVRHRREKEILGRIFATTTPEALYEGAFGMPLARNIPSSRFGVRRLVNGEKRSPHGGLDLKGKTGTAVHAVNGGRVVFAGDLFFTGKTVIIDHGLGIHSLYAHLSDITVRKGTRTKGGALIGRIGATGRVTGPHLHWAIKIGGEPVDPVSLLSLHLAER